MFQTTSLFLKVVCLNNTYNLSLIVSAYNDFDFFIEEILRSKTAKFWIELGGVGGGWGGGVKRVRNGFIFFMCSFGVILRV